MIVTANTNDFSESSTKRGKRSSDVPRSTT